MKKLLILFMFVLIVGGAGGAYAMPPASEIGPNTDLVVNSVTIGSEDSFAVDTDGDGDADYIFISTVPTTAADTCTTGTIVFDDTYIYRCVSTDTWKRASMATW